jgi:hypothetical protein
MEVDLANRKRPARLEIHGTAPSKEAAQQIIEQEWRDWLEVPA